MGSSKNNMEIEIATQKDQLIRYEKRLKDVITAYKGLLKEKEALKMSLAAVSSPTPTDKTVDKVVPAVHCGTPESRRKEMSSNDKNHLQSQIVTLMNSLATLSAEKSRMESSFQAANKQIRAQLAQKDITIYQLQEEVIKNEKQAKISVEKIKTKWLQERRDHDKEINSQLLMIRELQKLYSDECQFKDNMEMQLKSLKMQFPINKTKGNNSLELEVQLKEAKMRIKQLEAHKTQISEPETPTELLHKISKELQWLKEQHAIAIGKEQRRLLLAVEDSTKQALMYENRTASLEKRLSEISSTISNYGRLRQDDLKKIQMLKSQIQLHMRPNLPDHKAGKQFTLTPSITSKGNMVAAVDEIFRLKKLLTSTNACISNSIDVNKVSIHINHDHCQEEINQLRKQWQTEVGQLEDRIKLQKSHICTLQEKVKVLNRNIEEHEEENKMQTEKLRHLFKQEQAKWEITLSNLENEFYMKVNNMDQQLQNQSQRLVYLLKEREKEIKFLKYQNKTHINDTPVKMIGIANVERLEKSCMTSKPQILQKKSDTLSVSESCHMLYYANEIARKDIEIASLRKAKYIVETSLRKTIQEKASTQRGLHEKIILLEEQVGRLECCKTREGANLEYLKNVIISYIVTTEANGKSHMLNAINAILQFTPQEIQYIKAAIYKK